MNHFKPEQKAWICWHSGETKNREYRQIIVIRPLGNSEIPERELYVVRFIKEIKILTVDRSKILSSFEEIILHSLQGNSFTLPHHCKLYTSLGYVPDVIIDE